MFDFVFESKRGKRERNAARASAISRERTRFPCVETAFARVFFSEAPALCSRARKEEGILKQPDGDERDVCQSDRKARGKRVFSFFCRKGDE